MLSCHDRQQPLAEQRRERFKEDYGYALPEGFIPGEKPKPDGCLGCPLYGTGRGFVPDEIRPDAEVLILLQNPGKTEEEEGAPACGKTGQFLNRTYLPLAGLSRDTVSVANVLKCRYQNSNNLPEGETLREAVIHCTQAHLRVTQKTRLVILQGALALAYATDTLGQPKPQYNITGWRGFLVPVSRLVLRADQPQGAAGGDVPGNQGGPVSSILYDVEDAGRSDGLKAYATLHTADLLRDSRMAWVAEYDWRRVRSILDGTYPAQNPPQKVVTSWDEGAESWFRLAASAQYIVCDTEYTVPERWCTTIGLCSLTGRVGEAGSTPALSVLQLDCRRCDPGAFGAFKLRLQQLVKQVPFVFHNAIADLQILKDTFEIEYKDYKDVQDTMLAHAALWCELPHDLEFLASYYGKHGKFKHLRHVDEILYNYGDVVDTASIWSQLLLGLQRDAPTYRIYREQSLALLPILLQAKYDGIRINKGRVLEEFTKYSGVVKRVERLVEASCGFPLNVKSGPQLQSYLYNELRLPLQLGKDTKRPTTDDDAIATLRRVASGGFDPDKEITLDRDDAKHYSILQRIADGAVPILECRVLYSQTFHVLNNYILGLCKGVYGEHSGTQKKKARTGYWKKGITLDDIVERIYPNFAIHAQKTGRWSTTDPPLAQLPADLRDIVCPDPDEVCISWDWSAIEPRVLQALSRSALLKKTFDDNFDLHTWTVCFMFGYEYPANLVDPHKTPECSAWREKYNWKGKDDPRRVFAKSGRYEMWYGGTGSNAAQAAAQFGLDPKELKSALNRLLTSDPDYYAWKVKTEAEVKRTSLTRTFMGRVRRFLSQGDSRRREGLDQPMQGAVSDIFNTTIILLAKLGYLRWGWGMHDSQKWYVKAKDLTPERMREVSRIVQRPHHINGADTVFPADLEILFPPESGQESMTIREYTDNGFPLWPAALGGDQAQGVPTPDESVLVQTIE